MSTKDKFAFLEESIGDMNETNTSSIETKANELQQTVIKNAYPREPMAKQTVIKPKLSSKPVEKSFDHLTPAIRKIIKKAESETVANLDTSMRFEKATMHQLKSISVELDIAAYKIVTVLIKDFIEKYKE